MALSKGYRQIIAEIDDRLAFFQPGGIQDAAKLHFWRAAKRVLEGALVYAENYANEADRLAAAEPDPVRQARLRQMAAACRRVPAETPRDLREALQAFWFTYLLGHLEGSHLGYSPGRLDQLLHPYFENDGTCGYDEAVELFEELFVKMTQIEYLASLSWQGLGHGNLYQNCILGGVDAEGKPADNENQSGHPRCPDPRADDPADAFGVVRRFVLREVLAQGGAMCEDGVRLSGLLQPEDLRRA